MTEALLIGLVMPIVVATITGISAVQWRKQSAPNPTNILGPSHRSLEEQMGYRAQENGRIMETLVRVETKLDQFGRTMDGVGQTLQGIQRDLNRRAGG